MNVTIVVALKCFSAETECTVDRNDASGIFLKYVGCICLCSWKFSFDLPLSFLSFFLQLFAVVL